MDKISVKSTAFVDESGRERIFNGINLVYKGRSLDENGNYIYTPPEDLWTEDVIRGLAEKGINLVRFGLLWAAIEPQPGIYNEEYLDTMEKYIDLCAKYGIYVYLDMHQDLYSMDFGDGAPAWATITDSYKYKPAKIIWAEGYFFNKAVQHSFDHFWNNTPINGKGLQDYFADMWKHVAERFKDKENLFGFDIFNEPYPGTDGGKIFKKILKSGTKTVLSKKVKKTKAIVNMIKGDFVTEALGVLDDSEIMRSMTEGGDMLVKKFDTMKYYPFLVKVSSAIREVTDKGIIMTENCYYSNTSIPCSTPKLRYNNGELEKNSAFAPHAYDLTVDSYYTNTASNKRVDTIFREHSRTQKRLGVPVIVGEWGGMVDGSDEYPHLEHLLELFDDNHWSQTYWAYMRNLLDSKIMNIISRPYPVAIPGNIIKYNFNRKNNTFTLKFNCDKITRKKAEVYVPCKPKEIISAKSPTEKTVYESDAVILSFPTVKGENEIVIKI